MGLNYPVYPKEASQGNPGNDSPSCQYRISTLSCPRSQLFVAISTQHILQGPDYRESEQVSQIKTSNTWSFCCIYRNVECWLNQLLVHITVICSAVSKEIHATASDFLSSLNPLSDSSSEWVQVSCSHSIAGNGLFQYLVQGKRKSVLVSYLAKCP